MLTFEQFQETREHHDALWEPLGLHRDELDCSGYLYDIGHIEEYDDEGAPMFQVVIDNRCWSSARLAEMERVLYDHWYVINYVRDESEDDGSG